MKFDKPATTNPIDRLRVVGKPTTRVDGPLKVSGRAVYAYERQDHDDYAYGYPVGAAIAKGRITAIDATKARGAPGVLAVVTTLEVGELEKGEYNTARLFGGDKVQHYHQAIAVVIAETFEQARSAAALLDVTYEEQPGVFDLEQARDTAVKPDSENSDSAVGSFQAVFDSAANTLDATYRTPDHSHAMMEPHASVAVWEDD